NWYIEPFHNLVVWIGGHVLHLEKPITVFTNGSGDTTYDNIILLLIALLALIGMIIWSVIDRGRAGYNKLFYWLTVVLRYYVAITMLSYGFYKVIKLQFPFPNFGRLMEPYGNSSPMGLAWTFMGYSTGYNWFTGIAELSCGVLLFFRKTSALGAVMTLIVAGNIMAINYSFDVPVKLLSTTLVLMALFLILKDIKRFSNFFFFNKPAAASDIEPHRFTKRWKTITLCCIKYALIVYTLIFDLHGAVKAEKEYGSGAPKSPLYGLYDAKTFIINKDTLKPMTTNLTRWNKLAFDGDGYAFLKYMNDSTEYVAVKIDSVKRTIVINRFTDTLNKYHFSYIKPKKDSLYLVGKFKKDSIRIMFHRDDPGKFLLVRRGFHWINEYPYNR
ncbi:MAG: DoxX family protein, partial [Bacteroidetes bacterium]|nr:DoxX family protein [Bacteroidota bacterium]